MLARLTTASSIVMPEYGFAILCIGITTLLSAIVPWP